MASGKQAGGSGMRGGKDAALVATLHCCGPCTLIIAQLLSCSAPRARAQHQSDTRASRSQTPGAGRCVALGNPDHRSYVLTAPPCKAEPFRPHPSLQALLSTNGACSARDVHAHQHPCSALLLPRPAPARRPSPPVLAPPAGRQRESRRRRAGSSCGGSMAGVLQKYVAQAMGKASFRDAWKAGGWKMLIDGNLA